MTTRRGNVTRGRLAGRGAAVTAVGLLAAWLGAAVGCRSPRSYHVYRGHPSPPAEKDTSEPAPFQALTLAEPLRHESLSVYPLEGPDALAFEDFLTLQEALEQEEVLVREVGQVHELVIVNRGSRPVFIHAGDIVRGGKQDRLIPNDMILPPHSGKVPLSSFCVESGRWTRRGGESAEAFSASENIAYGRRARIASRLRTDQSGVWRAVRKKQDALSRKLGRDVRDARSGSSLELTLANAEVRRAVAAYERALGDLPRKHPDAVGAAVVIGGRVYGADVYCSRTLFRKLWGKLLKAVAAEAVAAGGDDRSAAPAADADDLRRVICRARDGRRTRRAIHASLDLKVRTDGRYRLFRTVDTVRNVSLHDSYVVDPDAAPAGAADDGGRDLVAPALR
jgi:hypothetical protein